MTRRTLRLAMTAACVLAFPMAARAAAPAAAPSAADVGPLVDRAIEHLRAAQGEDGSFSPHLGPAVTALVATGLLENGRSPADPLVSRALAYVETFVHEDGGVYAPDSTHKNYETAIAVQAFHAASQAPGARRDYADLIGPAERFLKGLQWDQEEGHDESSENYGGAGYGRSRRPDLSNTSFLLDALHDLGRGPDDPAIAKALVFVSRCQNLETEHNATPFAAKVGDGGFYYTPAAGGASMAGEAPGGGLRSYGSMTYAGLKSMIYAGLTPDDPRVRAAMGWLRDHYTVDENPGMGEAGLFYYLQSMARALDAVGEPTFVDSQGVEHAWRGEIASKLAALQQKDGSWLNANDRWLEADPNLVTGYALLILARCK